MLDRQSLLTLFDGVLENFVLNLDFIPADKGDWKPAPEANSPLEIVNHLAGFLGSVSQGLAPNSPAFTPATNLDEAKRVLTEVGQGFSAAVRGASPEKLKEMFSPEREITYGWICSVAVVDTMHHAGQIAYLQTMLGDTEFHGNFSAVKDFIIS